MATITKSTKFPAKLQKELFNAVKGKSSVAKMAAAEPIPFNGLDVFTFAMDNEVSVVGEGAAKPAGGATVTPVQIRPIKIVYQSRVSEEFMYASEEEQLEILRSFSEGFARKMARGLDIMALTGVNPATGTASAVIGNNHLSYVVANYSSGANVVDYNDSSDNPVDVLTEAIEKVDCNGIIMGTTLRSDIAALKDGANGAAYPEFAFGGYPEALGKSVLDVNETVEAGDEDARAYVGNWDAFKWGFAKEMPLEVIEYGNPDGGTYDLKQANEVLLRSEAFIGWGFLDASAFAEVVAAE